MGNPTNTCRWVKRDSTYCEKPVAYHMEWDGGEIDSTKVRVYDTWCALHKEAARQQQEQRDT